MLFLSIRGILNLTLNTLPEYTRYFISYLFYMLSGRIERFVFVHAGSHMICSNIEIQLLNNNCLNIS